MTSEKIDKREIANEVIKKIIEGSLSNGASIHFYRVRDQINNEIQSRITKSKSFSSSTNPKKNTYSDSSIRRRLMENDCIPKKGSSGEYIYAPLKSALETPRATLLEANDFLCYTISPACFTPLIASSLNQEFKNKIFQAVTIDNVLICLYLNKDKVEWEDNIDEDDAENNDDSDNDYYLWEEALSFSEINGLISRLLNYYKRRD